MGSFPESLFDPDFPRSCFIANEYPGVFLISVRRVRLLCPKNRVTVYQGHIASREQ